MQLPKNEGAASDANIAMLPVFKKLRLLIFMLFSRFLSKPKSTAFLPISFTFPPYFFLKEKRLALSGGKKT